MRKALIFMGCLFFISLLTGTAFGQEANSENSAIAIDGENKSIQEDLLENRIAEVNHESIVDQTAPNLNMKELTPLVPTTPPAGIGYPLSNPITETPKGKIYPSQTERDVVVGVLLSAALQKLLP
ncbi:MAG: hypothetical protein ACRBF0_08290 [Calditrichia bacterium]